MDRMKSKDIAKQLFATRTKLHEAKVSGRSIEIAVFSQFKTYLQQLKQVLSTEKQGTKKDQAIAQLLQCFEDDTHLGTSGYSYIHSTFTDNKSNTGDKLLQYIAQYEQQHSDKILLRDYQNYSNKKLPEGIKGTPYLSYQINHIIELIFKGIEFDIQRALLLGQELHHYVQVGPTAQEDVKGTTKDIIFTSKLYTLSTNHQNILKRKLQSFLQNPSEQGVLQLITTFTHPSRIDQCIQQVDNHRNGIITIAALSALAFMGKQAYSIWHDPFLSDTSHKVTYYQDKQEAYNKIQEYNAYYDTVENGKYRHQMVEVDEEELEEVISIQEIKENWKKNTQLFFDKLPKENGVALYVGQDSATYFFTEQDIQNAHALIDGYDMRPLQKAFHEFCRGVHSSIDPEELLKPILTNISFFPLGNQAAGIQTDYSESNKIILINTSFIAPRGKVNYTWLTEVLLHELIHCVFGHKPFVIATEGKTDRYTDYYLYKALNKDNFSPTDPYALFKVADGLYTMNIYSTYVGEIANNGFRKAFFPQAIRSATYPNQQEIAENLNSLLTIYQQETSPELFRAIKVTKVYQLLQEYPEHIIDPKIFIAVIDDTGGQYMRNLQSLYEESAGAFDLTPKTLAYIHEVIAKYKKSKDYQQFHQAQTPQERVDYFDKVKSKYIGEHFDIDVNTPYKPGINWDGGNDEKESKIPRGTIVMVTCLAVTLLIALQFTKNFNTKVKLVNRLSNKADINTMQPVITGSTDGIMGLSSIFYLFLISITLPYYMHHKDAEGIASAVTAFFVFYALARIRRATVLQKETHIQELSNTIAPTRNLMHKTHLLQDLIEHNRNTIQAYKEQVHNVITEKAPWSYINFGSYTTNKAALQIKDSFILNAMSQPIPDRITHNIYAALGIKKDSVKKFELTQGELQIIGPGDKISGKINRRKSAQQPEDKLVITPYEYKASQPKPNKKGNILVSICLDIRYDQNTINNMKAYNKERKNFFKDGEKTIGNQIYQWQQEKIQEIIHYMIALYHAKDLATKYIKVALTLDGKIIQIIHINSMSLADIRNTVNDIYDIHFKGCTLRTYQGFSDDQFLADHIETTVPEEVISIGYKPSKESFGHQIKHLKQEIGAPSTVHIIDCRGILTKDYAIPKD